MLTTSHSHASIDPAVRAARNLPEDLIRLCVGIEDPADLIDDLEAALLEAGAVRTVDEASSALRGERLSLERTGAVRGDGLVRELEGLGLTGERARSDQPKVETIMTSAPGKVILFGEHAVVHGVVRSPSPLLTLSLIADLALILSSESRQTAIAGAIDLRCYCLAEARADGFLSLVLPDMAYSQTWDPASLPWDKVAPFPPPLSSVLKLGPKGDFVPDHELLTLLANQYITRDVAAGEQGLKAVQSAQAFLYLYMHVASVTGLRPAQTYTIRAGLPVSAGLGSSAAFSVSVSSALLYSHGVLPVPASSSSRPEDSSVAAEHAHLVNAWAFVAEKVLHGNPSGVDNTVSALGGAIAYRRAISGRQEQSLKSLKGFDEIPFLITDTKVPRDTKTLVAGVARRKLEVSLFSFCYDGTNSGSDVLMPVRFTVAQEPDTIIPLLDSIQRIADQAESLLASSSSGGAAASSSTTTRHEQLSDLARLIEQNHSHLVSLGVSHPALETVRNKTRDQPWGLVTKLTGAGGGGCAVTVVPDGAWSCIVPSAISLVFARN